MPGEEHECPSHSPYWLRARSTVEEKSSRNKECWHLSYHEVVIDVFQVAIATGSNGLVELPELLIEVRELISEKEGWESILGPWMKAYEYEGTC